MLLVLGSNKCKLLLENNFFIILKQLVSVNGHLGYPITSWNTQNRMYVWGIRYNYHILNLSKTLYSLRNIFFHIKYLLNLKFKKFKSVCLFIF